MAWRKQPERFPAPLREFREEDWPPVPGECLGHYSCRRDWHNAECTPPPGEECGDACYKMLAAEYPGRPDVLAAARKSDAYERFHQARLNWIGEDSDDYITEFIEGCKASDAIRYAPFRDPENAAHGA